VPCRRFSIGNICQFQLSAMRLLKGNKRLPNGWQTGKQTNKRVVCQLQPPSADRSFVCLPDFGGFIRISLKVVSNLNC
jgi:hypothetical protein